MRTLTVAAAVLLITIMPASFDGEYDDPVVSADPADVVAGDTGTFEIINTLPDFVVNTGQWRSMRDHIGWVALPIVLDASAVAPNTATTPGVNPAPSV